VLVTGAGGSIGSELCRQILSTLPQQLLLYNQNRLVLKWYYFHLMKTQ
jgi:FlaA1/EpsC-like NDP-sugar epimerase